MIEIVPAIDLIGGKCVRLTAGDYAAKKMYGCDPVDMAMKFADCGVGRIHVVDLDGAKASTTVNLKVLEKMAAKTGVEIEWGGGISGLQELNDVFNAGATQAIIGSVAALRPAEFSQWLLEFGPEKIILGADVKNGGIAVKGWQQKTDLSFEELLGWFLDDGLKYVISTEISRDGMLCGPAFDFYSRMLEKFPGLVFTASGGISCMADIEKLDAMGMQKVIVGKAIYEEKISLKDIQAWQSQRG